MPPIEDDESYPERPGPEPLDASPVEYDRWYRACERRNALELDMMLAWAKGHGYGAWTPSLGYTVYATEAALRVHWQEMLDRKRRQREREQAARESGAV
jgi:hypothetical protein